MNIRDIIFSLFGSYEHQADVNKDSQGKGTHERFNEIVGKDIDEELKIKVDRIVEYNLDPYTCLDKFIPYLEHRIGVTLFLGNSIEMRRVVLKHYLKWLTIRSTLKCYHTLFGMLGFQANITEYFLNYSFDSPVTFDDEGRVFDMQGCNRCYEYSIALTGSVVITPDLIAAIMSIIKWNEPINAVLKSITYNGNPLIQEIIEILIDANGDLVYWNEYDPELILSLDSNGDLIIDGPNASHYSIDAQGNLIYTI